MEPFPIRDINAIRSPSTIRSVWRMNWAVILSSVHRIGWGLALLAGGWGVGAQENKLAETRSTLDKWVETRQLIARVRADWQADKETLEQSIKLFESERARSAEAAAQVETGSQQAEKERLEQERLNQQGKAAQEKMKSLVADLEKQTLATVKRLPPPVVEKLQPLLKLIPADPASTKAPLVNRIQYLLGVLNEADKFNQGVSVVSEVRKNPTGAEVQVKTLYLGLAQAWFVDKSGAFAGTGTPGAEGWEWTTQADLGPRINQAIAMYENTQPAAFVALPAQVK